MSEYSLPQILSFSLLCVQSSINADSIKLSRSKPSAKRDELAVSLQQREQVVSALSDAVAAIRRRLAHREVNLVIDGIPKGDNMTIKAGLLIAIEDAEKSCRIYQGLWERLDKNRSPKLPRTYEPYYIQPWKKAKERLQFLNNYMQSIYIEIAPPAHH